MTVKIFFCYAREDEALLNKLKTHLRPLQRRGLIDVWHDRDISAGAEWEQEISQHLNAAQIILLLVSPDFMDSDYCYGIEMKRAIERHEREEAQVVPVILRPTLWRETSLGKLQALPKDAKPVISWPNVDDALFSIAEGIRDIVIERRTAEEEQARKAREELAQPLVTSPESAAQEVEERSEVIPLSPPAPSARAPDKRFGTAEPLALISRRTVVLTLVALGAVGAGGTAWLVLASIPHTHRTSVPTPATLVSTPTSPPAIPTPPLGATLLTYKGHSNWVYAVAWSPDGKRIASGSFDNTVQVWDASTGGNVLTYKGHSDIVLAVAWSPDGRHIASGSRDATVQVWDASTGAHALTYKGHSGSVLAVAWSPDGRHIASGSYDETVQVWNASTGAHVLTYKGHSSYVSSVAWSPDGNRIASAADNVQVWDATTGAHVLTYKGLSGWASSVAWSPEGKRIASGSVDKTVQVWDAASGGKVYTYRGHSAEVNAVTWSPNGRRIASASADKTVQVWDASTGGHVLIYQGHSGSVFALAWSPEGKRIASGSVDKTVQVWSAG